MCCLERIERLLQKVVSSEAAEVRKPRRSAGQNRQLSSALRLLRADPSHNVKAAARAAFRTGGGYESLESLYYALRTAWVNRA